MENLIQQSTKDKNLLKIIIIQSKIDYIIAGKSIKDICKNNLKQYQTEYVKQYNLLDIINNNCKYKNIIILQDNMAYTDCNVIDSIIDYFDIKNGIMCQFHNGIICCPSKIDINNLFYDCQYYDNQDKLISVKSYDDYMVVKQQIENQIIKNHIKNGVIFATNNVIIESDVIIENGVKILNNNVIKGKSIIKNYSVLRENNVIIDSEIDNCSLCSNIIENSQISNSTIKNSNIEVSQIYDCIIKNKNIQNKTLHNKNIN